MNSLLNTKRPPVFCPGCGHKMIVNALDKALQNMGLRGDQIAIVSDIGCSGLFDTFFNTHAFHGLHGRALTYATGLKMVSPDLNVIVTMGDGGLGIGGAHLLSTCRRNIDLTLLILNNFNYGMTGGQCSSTTPSDAQVSSGFLNQLEKPMDVCQVAVAAGAEYACRTSAYQKNLPKEIEMAIRFNGFSVMDMWGICPGRYTKKNRLTPQDIDASLSGFAQEKDSAPQKSRKEYSRHYKETIASLLPSLPPIGIEKTCDPPDSGRQEIVILGSAGQRIVTAGEVLCIAGISAGLHATQKNDYPITVLRGHSISELVLSEDSISYTGIHAPTVILALDNDGTARQKTIFADLSSNCIVLKAKDVEVPPCNGSIFEIDFKAQKVKPHDRALFSLSAMATLGKVITYDMLKTALEIRFTGKIFQSALDLIDRIQIDMLRTVK